ncbi:acyl-CoA synthetases/AMP-acid ligases II, partial [Aureobasidium melanogenum]
MHASLLPPLHIPTDVSFGQFLLKYNPDHVPADKVVLEDLAEPRDKLTYGGIRHETAHLAGALHQVYGIRPGDAVILYAVNSVAWLRLAHAVMWMGGVLVCINAAVSEHELPHYLKISRATHCFGDAGLCPKMNAALEQSPGIRTQVLELGSTLQKLKAHSASPLQPIDLSKTGNQNTVAMVLFSSGTSSLPKGVQLSHYNLLAQALSARVSTPETTCQDAREVFFPPLAHMFGLASVVLPTAVSGSYVMLMPSFTYPGFIEGSARIRANVMRTVPAIAVMIAKDPNISKYDLSCVKSLICAGATLQEEIVSRLQDVFAGVEITQGYGMTETSVTVLRGHRSVDKRGSVGTLMANSQIKIVDEARNEVPTGTMGELLIKSPSVFFNYRGDDKATKDSFHDGWLCTGDMLRVDEDGFFWFMDRKKEMIKYKGNQIPPAQLEDLLLRHAAVQEAAVCATWDAEQQTEIPIGYVVLSPEIKKQDYPALLKEIRESVDSKVSGYKKLRGGVVAIDALPKNHTGKLARNELPARKEMLKMMEAKLKAKL